MSMDSVSENFASLDCNQCPIKVKEEFTTDFDGEQSIFEEICPFCCKKKCVVAVGGAQINDTEVLNQSFLCECETLQRNSVKEEVKEEPDDKINKVSSDNNLFLRCDVCNEEYKDYCSTCLTLMRIFHDTPKTNDDMPEETIPKHILEMKHKPDGFGIFTLKSIPKNVIFGPFNELIDLQESIKRLWKIKNKKFVCDEDIKCINWMQYVNCAEYRVSNNLEIFQYKNELYYRSNQEIAVGEELLVWFDEEKIIESRNNKDMWYNPSLEIESAAVYGCTFCCLGFGTDVHLLKHKTICPNNNVKDTVEEIVLCSVCMIYLVKSEYLGRHIITCSEKSERKSILSTPVVKGEDHYREPIIFVEVGDNYMRQHGIDLNGRNRKCKLTKHLNSNQDDEENDEVNRKKKKPIRTSSAKAAFECKICGKTFTRRRHFKLHIKSKHTGKQEKEYKCASCSFETNYKENLIRHFPIHNAVKPYVCSECGKGFTQKDKLQMHIKNNHTDRTEKDFKCTECSLQTNYKGAFKKHLRTHDLRTHDDVKIDNCKMYKCNMCDKEFTQKESLSAHVRIKHLDDNEKPFHCPQCSYKTHYRINLNRHLYTHACAQGLAKRFECDRCEASFTQKTSLTSHIKNLHSESGEKDFKCPQCPYQTNKRYGLKQHLNAHNNVKPYGCEMCSRRFTQMRNLKNHMKSIHADDKEKRFVCTECTYVTNDNSRFKQHLHVHEMVRPYECEICNKGYLGKRELVKHMQKNHADLIDYSV